jgi:hypothetical protein
LSIVAETTEKTKDEEEASAACSGEQAIDYACHQERYQNLVLGSGVEAAFAELKDEYKKSALVKNYYLSRRGILLVRVRSFKIEGVLQSPITSLLCTTRASI